MVQRSVYITCEQGGNDIAQGLQWPKVCRMTLRPDIIVRFSASPSSFLIR